MKILFKLKALLARIGNLLILIACGGISLFLLASSYESIYNRSVPFVHAIDDINLSAFKQSYDLNQAVVKDERKYGNYGKPVTLKFPQRAARLDIVAPLKQSETWLARANTLHLLVLDSPRNGNIGISLMYCRAGFRTVNSSIVPPLGSNIFIDTDHAWRYVYKITSTSTAEASRAYVIADGGGSSKLVISCYDSVSTTNTYIEATLLSVQGIDT